MNWKDFFYFSRRERIGLLFLVSLVIGIIIGKFLFEKREPALEMLMPETITKPNTSDSTSTLQRVTESSKSENLKTPLLEQSRSVVNKSTENSAESRTYYIREKKEELSPQGQSPFPKSEKIPEGTTIDLNRADSVLLCKVPGIGPAFSRRIISYRNILGGYYCLEQLQEVYGMYEELYEKITPFFEITTDSIRTISVNSYSLDRLRSHPYLNFYQAKAIVEIRKKTGKLKHVYDLVLLEEFSEEDLQKLTPYLDFE